MHRAATGRSFNRSIQGEVQGGAPLAPDCRRAARNASPHLLPDFQPRDPAIEVVGLVLRRQTLLTQVYWYSRQRRATLINTPSRANIGNERATEIAFPKAKKHEPWRMTINIM